MAVRIVGPPQWSLVFTSWGAGGLAPHWEGLGGNVPSGEFEGMDPLIWPTPAGEGCLRSGKNL